MESDKRAWFRPKRYGYGASPASWQGWVATAVFIVIFCLAILHLRGVLRWMIGAALIVEVIVVVRITKDGEWRWRWGDK